MRRFLVIVALACGGCEWIVHFDDVPEQGEQCADGLDNDGDGLIDCKDPGCADFAGCMVTPAPRCGDHIMQTGEECDDGNTADNDGCSATCKIERCGDQIVQTSEECDDGNTVEGDACDSNCTRPRCGNGIVDPPRAALGTPVTTAVPGGPALLASADFDGDGRVDLAVATGSQVVLLHNDGGTFTAGAPVTAAGTIVAIAAADLDGDGRPDVMALDSGKGALTPLIFGDGVLTAGQGPSVGPGAAGLALIDVDGNGATDLAVSNGAGTVTIVRNLGQGIFRAGQALKAESGASAVAAADFDGDGLPDLVVADGATGHLSYFRAIGSGEFATAVPVTVGTGPGALAVADLDGDGRPDLVVADVGSKDLSVLLDRQPDAFAGTTIGLPAAPAGVAALDLDGDGDLDLVVTLAGGGLLLLGNDGAGGFTTLATVTLGGAGAAVTAFFADGDARPDVAVVEPGANQAQVLLGAGQTEQCDGGTDCTVSCTLPGGVPQWTVAFGAGSAEDVAVDDDGNVYVVGTFSGSLGLGGSPPVAAGGTDVFVASFTGAGTLRWRATFGGSDDDAGHAIAWDPAHRTLVVGGSGGPISFGSVGFDAPGRAFLATLDPASGAATGAIDVVGPRASGAVTTVAVDARGRTVAGGHFTGSIPNGAGAVVTGPAAFLTAYGAGGAQAWLDAFTGSATNDLVRARIDAAGIAVQGVYQGALPELDLDSATPAGFVARFDVTGVSRWVVSLDADGGVAPADLVLDPLGQAVAFGSFTGTIDANHPSAGDADDYVAALSPAGDVVDLRTLGGATDDSAGAIASDARGQVAIGGAFPGGVVARLSADRESTLWSQPGAYAPLRFAVDRAGFILVAGRNTGGAALVTKLRP